MGSWASQGSEEIHQHKSCLEALKPPQSKLIWVQTSFFIHKESIFITADCHILKGKEYLGFPPVLFFFIISCRQWYDLNIKHRLGTCNSSGKVTGYLKMALEEQSTLVPGASIIFPAHPHDLCMILKCVLFGSPNSHISRSIKPE